VIGYVCGVYRHALVDTGGGPSVATVSALAGVHHNPSGTDEITPDGRARWAVECHLAIARSGMAWDGHNGLPPLDLPDWADMPLVRSGAVTTPEKQAWLQRLFPDVRVRPYTRYFWAAVDLTPGRALVTLEVDRPPELWLDANWRDTAHGEPRYPTTAHPVPVGMTRVKTVRDILHIWRQPQDPTTHPVRDTGSRLEPGVRRTLPVRSRPELVQLVGKEGDDLLAWQVDPGALEGAELTIYSQADAWELTLEKVRRFKPNELVSRTGLGRSTIYRLLAGQTPSSVTAAIVAEAIAFEEPPEAESPWHVCAHPGCGLLVRGAKQWCSSACRSAANRARRHLALHAVGGKRCRHCGAARFGDQSAPCPVCQGQRPIEVPTLVCRGCGVERIGDTSGPCPFCKSKDAGP
jgi:hypothetical protein